MKQSTSVPLQKLSTTLNQLRLLVRFCNFFSYEVHLPLASQRRTSHLLVSQARSPIVISQAWRIFLVNLHSKKARNEKTGFASSSFSFPWSLALSHQSLASSRSLSCCRLKRLRRRQAWNCVAIKLALPGSRSVQTNEKSGRATKKRARENLQEEARGEPVRIFLNTPVGPLPRRHPEKPFFVSKRQKLRYRRVSHACLVCLTART